MIIMYIIKLFNYIQINNFVIIYKFNDFKIFFIERENGLLVNDMFIIQLYVSLIL